MHLSLYSGRPSPDQAPQSDVPTWVLRAAHAVPLVTLPSGLWRLALAAHLPVMDAPPASVSLQVYVVCLTMVTEGLALLTLGLVQPWGEVVPSWIPVLGGRRVPPMAAVLPAAVGATALTLMWPVADARMFAGDFFDYFHSPVQRVVVTACYLPLVAWGPLLGAVTVAYHRRRTSPSRAAVHELRVG